MKGKYDEHGKVEPSKAMKEIKSGRGDTGVVVEDSERKQGQGTGNPNGNQGPRPNDRRTFSLAQWSGENRYKASSHCRALTSWWDA